MAQERRFAAEHAASLPLAAEGMSPALCCVDWPLRKGSQGPPGVTSDTMVWSQARQMLCVAFTVFRGDSEVLSIPPCI